MKTLLKLSFYLIVAMLAFTSCKKDDDNKPSESSNNTGNGTGNNSGNGTGNNSGNGTSNSTSDIVGLWVLTDVKGEIKTKFEVSGLEGFDLNMVDFIKEVFAGIEVDYKNDNTAGIAYADNKSEAGKYEIKNGIITLFHSDGEIFLKGKLKIVGTQKTITVSADEQLKLMANDEELSVDEVKEVYDVSDIEYVFTKK